MSLGVSDMVQKGTMAHPDCILCGQCADTCPGQAIRLGFRRRG
ncbi:MAG: 4Fe-4S binding protein [Candidatus Bipolaricaulota bacterium]